MCVCVCVCARARARLCVCIHTKVAKLRTSQTSDSSCYIQEKNISNRVIKSDVVVVVDLLFYVHGKHLRSCRDGQLT